jgi:hypothetical protein
VDANELSSEFSSLIAPSGLLLLDALAAPALADDWSAWIERWHALEQEWLAPLLAALQAGKLGALTLILDDSSRLLTIDVNRASLRKFWVQPSLARMVP